MIAEKEKFENMYIYENMYEFVDDEGRGFEFGWAGGRGVGGGGNGIIWGRDCILML